MIAPINNSLKTNLKFGQNYDKDTLLKDSLATRIEMNTNNFVDAFTTYPAKGLKGSKNSNFHEFLTMGIFPYITGCATMLGVSMATNKDLSNADLKHANKYAKIVGLGIVFYGLFKKLSDGIINSAVKIGTGINTQVPYAKINYQLKEHPGQADKMSLEYHKIGESVDFPYWSLLYGEGKDLNKNFDKLAKRNGFGENLNDSDQEVKPAYKEVLVKSTFARNIVSYIWAATGVALANQNNWMDFDFKGLLPPLKKIGANFKEYKFKNAIVKSSKDIFSGWKDFGKAFGVAAKNLSKERFGKILLGLSATGSILGSANAIHIKNKPSNINVINPNKEKVEC